MMNAYAQASAAVSGDTDVPGTYGMCAANGCCLLGTMSASTQGPKDWWCRLHFGAPRREHDDITARIHNRRDLFKAAMWLASRGSGAETTEKVRARIRAMGRADLLTVGGIGFRTANRLGSHMLQVLGRECRAPQQHMGVPKNAAQGASWIDSDQKEETAA
jgi:hypothetical protein